MDSCYFDGDLQCAAVNSMLHTEYCRLLLQERFYSAVVYCAAVISTAALLYLPRVSIGSESGILLCKEISMLGWPLMHWNVSLPHVTDRIYIVSFTTELHGSLKKMADILQTTSLNSFCWVNIINLNFANSNAFFLWYNLQLVITDAGYGLANRPRTTQFTVTYMYHQAPKCQYVKNCIVKILPSYPYNVDPYTFTEIS